MPPFLTESDQRKLLKHVRLTFPELHGVRYQVFEEIKQPSNSLYGYEMKFSYAGFEHTMNFKMETYTYEELERRVDKGFAQVISLMVENKLKSALSALI